MLPGDALAPPKKPAVEIVDICTVFSYPAQRALMRDAGNNQESEVPAGAAGLTADEGRCPSLHNMEKGGRAGQGQEAAAPVDGHLVVYGQYPLV